MTSRLTSMKSVSKFSESPSPSVECPFESHGHKLGTSDPWHQEKIQSRVSCHKNHENKQHKSFANCSQTSTNIMYNLEVS